MCVYRYFKDKTERKSGKYTQFFCLYVYSCVVGYMYIWFMCAIIW